jgi:hypothetical protein
MKPHFSSITTIALLFALAACTALPHLARAADSASSSDAATTAAATAPSTAQPPAMLDLAGLDVFEIHCGIGGLSPQDRVDQITSRLTPLLGVPSIPPDAVRVYDPAGGNPSIYVLGRRIVTIDPKSAALEGKETSLQLATTWANKLQYVLPQVNYRKPGQPLPDLTLHPKVMVTGNLADVGGYIGEVLIGRKIVMRLRGVQPDGLTAAERADMIRSRLYTAIRTAKADGQSAAPPIAAPADAGQTPNVSSATGTTAASSQTDSESSQSTLTPSAPTTANTSAAPSAVLGATPAASASSPDEAALPVTPATDPVEVVPANPAASDSMDAPVELVVDGTPIITIDEKQALADGQKDPAALVNSWAKNIRIALAPPIPQSSNPAHGASQGTGAQDNSAAPATAAG